MSSAQPHGDRVRILFITNNGFPPQVIGGLETSTLELGQDLIGRGHAAAVMCRVLRRDWLWFRNRVTRLLSATRYPRDHYGGLTVYRGGPVEPAMAEVSAHFRPDVLVVQGAFDGIFDLALRALDLSRPTVFYVHDIGPFVRNPRLDALRAVTWICNSDFSARTLRAKWGFDAAVVPPYMRLDAYATESTREFVTMINPRKVKGGELALDVAARCPDIPFLFVEGWVGSDDEVRTLRKRASRLKNLIWIGSQWDMRRVYGRTRLLLVPSLCKESWGRVVTEGQASGIPAVVSDAGALPETTGAGGVVVPTEAGAEHWARVVGRLWRDPAEYGELSRRAAEMGRRPQVQPEHVAAQFLALIGSAHGR